MNHPPADTRLQPSVTVLIPVHCDRPGILRSLDSLARAQTRTFNLRVLVIDDGSTPALQIDPADHPALDLSVLRLERNAGIESALNAGLQSIRQRGGGDAGEFVARLDAGDTAEPSRLERQVAVLQSDPEVGLVASDAIFVDPAGVELFRYHGPDSHDAIRRRMHLNNCLMHPTVMMRMRVLDTVGDYSSDWPAAEDYELFLRILRASTVVSIPEVLTRKTASPDGISVRRRRAQLRSRLGLQWRFFDGTDVYSYLGILLTLVLMIIPNRLVNFAKRRAGASWL